MKPLHAPWRIQYILGPKPPSSESSIFSQMAAHPEDDEINYIIARGKPVLPYSILIPIMGDI